MHLCESNRLLNTGESTQFIVTFHKGLGSRRTSTFTETVELLNVEKIRSVVNLILSDKNEETKETLRANHMAGCSPRVFWSLVRLYGGDVEVGLRLLLPDKDWNWISSRRRTLSDKAKENLMQLQAKHKKNQIENTEVIELISEDNNIEIVDNYKEVFNIFCSRLSSLVNLREVISLPQLSAMRYILKDFKENENNLNSEVLTIANFSDDKFLDILHKGPSTISQLSDDSAIEILLTARDLWHKLIWKELVSYLFTYLNKIDNEDIDNKMKKTSEIFHSLGINTVTQLAMWRHAPRTLLEETNGELESLGITEDILKNATEIAQRFKDISPWLQSQKIEKLHGDEINIDEDEGIETEEDEEEEKERLQKDGWVVISRNTNPNDDEVLKIRNRGGGYVYLGKDVLIRLENENEDKDANTHNNDNNVNDIYSQGKIIAYLPATTEEPMALWKARLINSFDRHDLEEHELLSALNNFDLNHKQL